ncbi:unnamed protein product [Dracunculus medinensis]|uniref:G_PROTEIN_RECEP_F1_2 domain-containing protein n=1 Tax=Dracunculus medinensis TaxID=318479 RepID=A0A158Q5S5_DRAME|nr:unnamed protein product [Dracunculus medinensis]
MEGNLFTAFILYMFTLGFAIPVFLIILFYGLLVGRLFTRYHSSRVSQVPVNRIAIYTMAISIFFVVCWSPYWIAALYGLYRTQRPLNRPASTTFIYVMYGIHALPYVNSASNWLLYGLLNGQLIRRANIQKKSLVIDNKINEFNDKLVQSPNFFNSQRVVGRLSLLPNTTDSLL